jgi:hypothetical protein
MNIVGIRLKNRRMMNFAIVSFSSGERLPYQGLGAKRTEAADFRESGACGSLVL